MAAEGPYVMVTLVQTKGSAPRTAGTKMLVSDNVQHGTVGGGKLEYMLTEQARKFLGQEGAEYQFQHYALGPLLEQCCGGSVTVLLEKIEPGAAFLMEKRQAFLKTKFEGGNIHKSWCEYYAREPVFFQDSAGDRFEGEPSAAAVMLEQVARQPHKLIMFGAGHVGRAVATALAPLPFDVTWVDSRADEFPESTPANHTLQICEDYTPFIEHAPAGTLYLVFTHSHQLDYDVIAKILARGDAAYCGMIGSKTKRARFENRMLKERVITEADLPGFTCPIGIAGVVGKEPEVIAASVAAQLLKVADEVQKNNDAPEINSELNPGINRE